MTGVEIMEFYAARLDEDEAAAKAGTRRIGMPWRIDPEPWAYGTGIIDDIGGVGVASGSYAAEHMVRHNPARVLREVEARRKILNDYECQSGFSLPEGVHDGRDPDERECDQVLKDALEIIVADLAAVYSDHPDYDPAWAPAQVST
jgi:hypothetical protein